MVIIFISSLTGGGAEKVANMLAKYTSIKVPVTFVYINGSPQNEPSVDNCTFLKISARSTLLSAPSFMKLLITLKPSAVIAFGNSCIMVAAACRALFWKDFILVGSERSNLSRNNKFLDKWFGIYRYFLRVSFLTCDKIHCVSEGSKIDLCRQLNIASEKVTVIYNPITRPALNLSADSDRIGVFLKSLDGPIVFAVGRLSSEKDYHLLISAFASFRNCNGGNLVIFGEGDLLSILKEFALSIGVGSYVHFMGFVENPFRFSEYADLYVLCSKYEGYPNALLEALVSGVSVVATDCESGPREILTGPLSERLCPVGKVKSLWLKMDRFVGNCEDMDTFDHVSMSPANILEEYCMLLEVK